MDKVVAPVVVSVDKLLLPLTAKDEDKDTPDDTVKDEPIATLPVVPNVAVDILFVTDNESNIDADVTLREVPIPTLPIKLDIPVTFKVVSAAAESTVKDKPTPRLPAAVNVDVILPVPQTSKR